MHQKKTKAKTRIKELLEQLRTYFGENVSYHYPKNGEEAVNFFLKIINDKNAPAATNVGAFEGIKSLIREDLVTAATKERIVQELLQLLHTSDYDKSNVINALGSIGEVRAVDWLLEHLHDPKLTYNVVNALAGIGDTRPLLSLLNTTTDPYMRVNLTFSLTLLKSTDQKVFDVLIDTLENYEDKTHSYWAAIYLGDTGDERAIKPLIKALNNPVPRHNAAIALGKLKAKQAVQPLINVLFLEEVTYEHHAAAYALGEIGDPAAIVPLQKAIKLYENEVLDEGEETFVQIAQEAIDTIKKAALTVHTDK
jgi:HEAT repeat protein